MKVEVHRSADEAVAARLLGAGITRGNRLPTSTGEPKRGMRIAIGLWWVSVFIWLIGPDTPVAESSPSDRELSEEGLYEDDRPYRRDE